MSKKIEAKGSCLCGAVEIVTKSANTNVGACHCSMCRKWSGGPLLAIECEGDIQINGKENVTTFSSSEWAERGFCSKCGTHLFYRMKQSKQYIVPVGLLGLDAELTFEGQIFIDEKPSFYSFSNETKNMTGKEVFEQYTGS